MKSAIKEKEEKSQEQGYCCSKMIEKQKRKKIMAGQKGMISIKQKVATTISDDSNKAKKEQAGEGKDSSLYCNGLFAEDKNGEGWCLCDRWFCHRWVHDK